MVLPKQFMGTPVKCKCTPASSSIDFTTPNSIGIGAAGTGFCKLQGIAKCEIFQVGSMEFLLFFFNSLGFRNATCHAMLDARHVRCCTGLPEFAELGQSCQGDCNWIRFTKRGDDFWDDGDVHINDRDEFHNESVYQYYQCLPR